MLVVLTGAARSGKSNAAVALAQRAVRSVVFVATAESHDDEMAVRIENHKAERPPQWGLVEETVDLVGAIGSIDDDDTVIIDCLSLWVSNQIELADTDVLSLAGHLSRNIAARPGLTIVVTNEVGAGIVPMNALARRYRDLLGSVNQVMVGASDKAFLCVAGRLLRLDRIDDIL